MTSLTPDLVVRAFEAYDRAYTENNKRIVIQDLNDKLRDTILTASEVEFYRRKLEERNEQIAELELRVAIAETKKAHFNPDKPHEEHAFPGTGMRSGL